MTINLSDLHACFEGVIPSIVSTTAADGTPNLSYLSHVVMVDDEHVALSNQFFAKTSANIRANPKVTLLLVDGMSGQQYLLDIRFEQSVEDGPMFEHIALQLKASSAQVGMAGIMRLRSADVFRVLDIGEIPSAGDVSNTPASRHPARFAEVTRVAQAIETETEAGGIIDALLSGLHRDLRCETALVLLNDANCGTLTTVGSIGYEAPGLGSEVLNKDDLIAATAASGRSIKISDMSRVRRFGAAIISQSNRDENASRTIAFPRLADAMSQLAVPMIVQKMVRGVVFVESRQRLAFRDDDVAAIEILARQAASALALNEADDEDIRPAIAAPSTMVDKGVTVQISHHTFDDSIFIDNDYVIKGVAGRLLAFLIERHIAEGRNEFTNREIRLSDSLRLPDLKDNLETRLLLLRRRLEARQFPVRVVHSGRGKVTLLVEGTPTIRTID
jgi:adenylate cyclase